MKRETKIAILGFSAGFGLFFLLRRYVLNRSRAQEAKTPVKKAPSDIDIETAVFAYEEALQNDEDPTTLHDLNDSFGKEWGIQVQRRPADGVFLVTDMAGAPVASYDPSGQTQG